LQVEVINSLGQLLYTTNIENKTAMGLNLDFSAFSAGVYTLVLRDKDRQASYKILKQ